MQPVPYPYRLRQTDHTVHNNNQFAHPRSTTTTNWHTPVPQTDHTVHIGVTLLSPPDGFEITATLEEAPVLPAQADSAASAQCCV